MRWPLLLIAAAALRAATAADIVAAADASLSDTARDEPGSAARAEAIQTALDGAGELPVAERALVRTALAEAWLDAAQPARCIALATEILAIPDLPGPARERAALAWIAAARGSLRGGDAVAATTALDALAKAGDAGPRAAAHALVARAEIALVMDPDRKPADGPAALAAIDQALQILGSAPPAERVPVYLLRVTAMERSGMKPSEILAWLTARKDDPAAAEIAASAVADLDRLIGSPAPGLSGPRGDGAAQGAIDLSAFRGKTVLVDFFATWCQPCLKVAPAIVAVAKAHPDLQIIGVSLDNAATLAEIPAFMAKHGAAWPVIADGLGWDSELDDAWRVGAIPSLFLVAPDGRIVAGDLVGADEAETVRRIEEALANPGRPAAKPAAATDAIP